VSATSSLLSRREPPAAVTIGLSDLAILRRVLAMALRYRKGMAIAVATTIVAAAFQLLIPQYLGQAVDSAQGLLAGGDAAAARTALWQTGLLLLGASVLRGLFTMWHNYQGEAIGQRVAYDLRMAYYAQLQRLSFGFHDRVHTGELITRGMLDIEGIRMVINAGMSVMASTAAKAIEKFFVNASGLNSRPSCAARVKIGRNETAITSSEKKAGPATSFTA